MIGTAVLRSVTSISSQDLARHFSILAYSVHKVVVGAYHICGEFSRVDLVRNSKIFASKLVYGLHFHKGRLV